MLIQILCDYMINKNNIKKSPRPLHCLDEDPK